MYVNIGTKLQGGDEKKIPPLVCIMKSGPAPVRRGGRGVDLCRVVGAGSTTLLSRLIDFGVQSVGFDDLRLK